MEPPVLLIVVVIALAGWAIFASRPAPSRRSRIPARSTASAPASESDHSCVWCGGTTFDERSAQLNTPGLTFLNLDWANQTALCLVCRSCGYVHWFIDAGRPPDRRLEPWR